MSAEASNANGVMNGSSEKFVLAQSSDDEEACRINIALENSATVNNQNEVNNESDGSIENGFEDALLAMRAPSPPVLSAFVDTIHINDISPEIEKILVLNLDVTGVADSLKNWEFLAFELGMQWDEIRYLAERARHPESPTAEVLYRYRNQTLGQLLRIIRDKLKRYDIIIKLQAALLSLQEHRASKGKLKVAIGRDGNDSAAVSLSSTSAIDSGCFNDKPNVPSSSHAANHRLFTSRLSDNAVASSSIVKPISTSAAGPSKRIILVMYYPDHKEHIKYTKWLCVNLRKHSGNTASVIRCDQIDTNLNVTGGLIDVFSKASHIIVVLSVGLKSAVESAPSSADSSGQICRYMHRLLEAEYVRQSCTNLRVRVVCFPSTDARATTPLGCLSTTPVFHWPQQQPALFRLLFPLDDYGKQGVKADVDARNVDGFSLADPMDSCVETTPGTFDGEEG